MINIVICEDSPEQRTHIENTVNQFLARKTVDAKLVLSTANPIDVLNYQKESPNKRTLYFLDVDLQHEELNGIELGAKIRKVDRVAKIVFITTHSELAHLTFKHKVESLDYIVKNSLEEIEQRIVECITIVYSRYLNENAEQMKYYTANVFGEVYRIAHDDILFFETHPQISKRIILHTRNGKLDFRELISNVANLGPEFYHCQKSFVVNTNNIESVDKATRDAVMVNGSRVPVAVKKMSELLRRLER